MKIRGRIRNWRNEVDFWISSGEMVNRCHRCGNRPCDVGHELDCDLTPDPWWIGALNRIWNYWQLRRALLEVAPSPEEIREAEEVEEARRLATDEPVSFCTGCGWSAWTRRQAAAGCDCLPF